jgi:serine/threonine protein phosphatase PrpC
MGIESEIRTDVGLRRKLNEDSVVGFPERGLWVVADGMGGHEAGEVASALIVESMGRLPPIDDPEKLVAEAIAALLDVNAELIEMGRDGPETRTIGSTVVGLALGKGQYRCFWAGDSRAYRVRDGQIVQLTRDHSLVQDLISAGMLDEADAEKHPNANVITRAVGAAEDLRVDTVDGVVFPGDIFLLGSDGLTRVVSQVEMLATLYSKPLAQAADHLIEMVLARGAPDNVSLAIVRVV